MFLELTIILSGAIIASVVQGLSGFGFGLVAMSFWAWFLTPQLAAPLVVFCALLGQIVAAFTERSGWNLPFLLPFLFGGLIGIPMGLWILPRLDIDIFKIFLGIFLLIISPTLLYANYLPKINFGGSFMNGVMGVLGGIAGALGGFSGTFPALWCTLRGYSKNKHRAVIQNFNLTTLTVIMLGYIFSGIVTISTISKFALIAPIIIFFASVGVKIYKRIDESLFKQIVLMLLTLSGFSLLISGLMTLL